MKQNYIPLDQCVIGGLYRIRSRNLAFGVFKEQGGFVGIRSKFGNEYLFTEYHYDTGAPFGTVWPQELLEQCPITDLAEGHSQEIDGQRCHVTNKPLLEYLREKREQWQLMDANESLKQASALLLESAKPFDRACIIIDQLVKDAGVSKKVRVYPYLGIYEASVEGAVGSYVVGRGCSPMEAVGDLCMQLQLVTVRCDPPSELQHFKIDRNSNYRLSPADKRD